MLIEFHRRMLADEIRSNAFEIALRSVIRSGETTVADIGAGTGVLGFMAQRLGAREVHLIEQGTVIELAARLADANHIPGLHFWQAHSTEILDPPKVDVVVSEVLGNFALEENALETLADAHRFLKAGGVVIPARLEQWVAPIVTERFWRELCTWDRAPPGLDFTAAQAMSFDNIYVRSIEAADLPGGDWGRCWDRLEFKPDTSARRAGAVAWAPMRDMTIYGFACWWRCELVPGVVISTSPLEARTHWDQIYAPIARPLHMQTGDTLELTLAAETGNGETGIGIRWRADQRRGAQTVDSQEQDIGRGFIG